MNVEKKPNGYPHFLDGVKGPWWAKSALIMGPLAVMALLSFMQNMGFLPSPLMAGQEEMNSAHDGQTYLLQAICENTSQSEIEKLRCRPRPSAHDSSTTQNDF